MHLTNEQIARVTYAANCALCRELGHPEPPESAIAGHAKGVEFRRANMDAPESAQHERWRDAKTAEGYVHGDAIDHKAKTHPDLVPWRDLPDEAKAKGRLHLGIVAALTAHEHTDHFSDEAAA